MYNVQDAVIVMEEADAVLDQVHAGLAGLRSLVASLEGGTPFTEESWGAAVETLERTGIVRGAVEQLLEVWEDARRRVEALAKELVLRI